MGATQAGCVVNYEHNWVHSTPCAPLPMHAVVGGHDCDGAPMYVGRAYHEGDHLPAKVVPSKGCAYVCWGGEEHVKQHYEVLAGLGYAWVPCYAGSVPPTAVRSGATRSGEPLYVGRGHHANSLTVGKVHPSHGCLYIPFGGREVRVNSYEVLVQERREQWVTAAASYIPPGAVVAGHDTDAAPIYVGRALHEGELLPAKVVPNKGCAYVSFAGCEVIKQQFEVLIGHGFAWMAAPHQLLPSRMVSSGQSRYGEPLYVGRGYHHGSLTPGRVSLRQHCLFIPYGGREIRLEHYEVLCRP